MLGWIWQCREKIVWSWWQTRRGYKARTSVGRRLGRKKNCTRGGWGRQRMTGGRTVAGQRGGELEHKVAWIGHEGRSGKCGSTTTVAIMILSKNGYNFVSIKQVISLPVASNILRCDNIESISLIYQCNNVWRTKWVEYWSNSYCNPQNEVLTLNFLSNICKFVQCVYIL